MELAGRNEGDVEAKTPTKFTSLGLLLPSVYLRS
jgi:hypothetical protein